MQDTEFSPSPKITNSRDTGKRVFNSREQAQRDFELNASRLKEIAVEIANTASAALQPQKPVSSNSKSSTVIRAPGTYKMSKAAKRSSSSMFTMKSVPASRGARMSTSNKPKFGSTGRGIVIEHKEMIGSLISSGTTLAFSATGFVVNPGKPSGFPWLSTIASNFDKYIMRRLVVHLVSSQPTSTAGRIGIGIDYDSTDTLPADRVDFFNLTHHAECAAWDSVKLIVPLRPEEKFINSHTTSDSKLIDMGQIVVMSDQIVATSSVLADIIFEYHVELLEPQQAPLYTGSFTGPAVATFASQVASGPAVGSLIPTASTTVAEYSLPQGCYLVNVVLFDSAGGSPVCTPAVHGGTGRLLNTATTTISQITASCKITTNDGSFRLTYSGVTIANLETNTVVFTRISPAVHAVLAAASINNLPSGLATY